jgi:hypothetical protein
VKYQRIPLSMIVSFLISLSACAPVGHLQNIDEVRWTPLAMGRAAGVEIFVDENSIRHMSGTVRLRIKYRYVSPKPFDSGYIDQLVVYNEYNCDNKKTHKILWSEAHYIDGGSKRDLLERQGYILPNDAVFHYVCK